MLGESKYFGFGQNRTVVPVVLFALVGILPGTLIYGVSVQFLAKSIESWFEVRIDKALEGGLNLGRNALDSMLKDLNVKADAMALSLSVRPGIEHAGLLNGLREQIVVVALAIGDVNHLRSFESLIHGLEASEPARRFAGRYPV